MKSRKIWLGLPLIVLVLSILFTGCDDLLGGLGGGETKETVKTPTATPVAAKAGAQLAISTTSKITLNSSTAGADIRYTTDGNTPTKNSTEYEAPFSLPVGSATLKVIAVKDDMKDSAILTVYYKVIADAVVVTVGSDDATAPAAGSLRKAYNDLPAAGGTIIIDPIVSSITLKAVLDITKTTVTIEGNSVLLKPDMPTNTSNGSLIEVQEGKTLNVSRVHFNKAREIQNPPNGNGGAIYNRGTIVAESCIFSYNTAVRGGAIFNRDNGTNAKSSLTLKGCTFYANTVATGSTTWSTDGGIGGAIFNNKGVLNITGNLFYENKGDNGKVGQLLQNVLPGSTFNSYGYNVIDMFYGIDAGKGGWTADPNGKDATLYTNATSVAPSLDLDDGTKPFDDDFVPLSDLCIIKTTIAGFPNVDFYGQFRSSSNGAAGAVNAK